MSITITLIIQGLAFFAVALLVARAATLTPIAHWFS